MTKEYWNCCIGPIERDKVPFGGDFPLRQAVKKAFRQMLGEDAESCSSGWGMDEEEKDAVCRVHLEAFKRRNMNRTM